MPKYIDIVTPALFDFEKSRNRSEKEVGQEIDGGTFYKALRNEDELLAVKVSEHKSAIRVLLLNETLSAKRKAILLEHFNECFDLDSNLKRFYKMAKTDEVLSPLVKCYQGQHLHRIPDLFETLCWAIIGQQINVSFAHAVKTDFVKSTAIR